MSRLPNNAIDLIITSPPYGQLRKYDGFDFDFLKVSKSIFRILKDGGVLVWVVSDQVVNGTETCSSFEQAIHFKQIGFNLHDTMIWRKPNPMPHIKRTVYTPSFEYMFVFSKGKPKTTNILTEPTKYAGRLLKTHTTNPESIRRKNTTTLTRDKKIRPNVWDYTVAGTNYGHPAIFPLELAFDHIKSWSNEGDTIYDPFLGSGTVGVAAHILNRKFFGSEVSKEYCEIAVKRIEQGLVDVRKD